MDSLNGSFLIAAIDGDADECLVATDRLATRPCFWTVTDSGPMVASESTPVVSEMPSPRVNRETVAEFLALGRFTWGTKTLVEDLHTIPPATILGVEADGAPAVTRYWRPDFDSIETGFADSAEQAYRRVVSETVDGVSGDIGFRLTGGLDSRTLAEVLSEQVNDCYSVTFDANPAGDVNPRIAASVANCLSITNERQHVRPDEFVETIDRGIRLTNGLTPWTRFYWFPFLFSDLREKIDVLIDAKGQGELFGEDIFLEDVRSPRSPAETLYRHWSALSPDEVDEYVSFDATPIATIRRDGRTIDRDDSVQSVLQGVFENFYPNFHFRASPPIRS